MPRTKGAKNMTADAVLRRDFLSTYRKLGGKKWLEQWAKDNPVEFAKAMTGKITQPAPVKTVIVPEQPRAGELNAFEAARRVAYIMAKALHDPGESLTVEGEIVEPAPAWTPPADQPVVEQPPQGAVEEQPALPAPAPEPEAKPERRSLADLLGFEPPAVAQSLYGGGFGQYQGSAEEHASTAHRDLIGPVPRRESVTAKYRRMKGG